MSLFRNKYRVETTRLKGWDYAAAGLYFVTICTRERAYFFGEVIANQMRLSAIGETAARFWRDIPQHYARVSLDEFVVMPNHVHGIVVVNATEVETRHVASLPTTTTVLWPTETRIIVQNHPGL
jgi:putative transposase